MKIPGDIRDRAELHPEISLAENVHRLATHPMDEFEAFARLVEAGRSAEEVAARFGTTVRHVEGRLALGRLCDEAREAYRAGDITLDVAKRSEEHTSELQSLMRTSSAGFCLKKKNNTRTTQTYRSTHNQHIRRQCTTT